MATRGRQSYASYQQHGMIDDTPSGPKKKTKKTSPSRKKLARQGPMTKKAVKAFAGAKAKGPKKTVTPRASATARKRANANARFKR